MKTILLSLMIASSIPVFAQNSGLGRLIVPLKILADSEMETCLTCRDKLHKKAFRLLNDELPAGKIITSTKDNPFVLVNRGNNQFTLLQFAGKQLYRDPGEKKIFFTSISFRFHTEKNKLVGIGMNDVTGDELAEQFRSLAEKGPFSGEIQLVSYRYGAGDTFTYSPAEQELVVHCWLILIAASR